ncbi:hypothetical protein ACHAXN_000569 [Cyclotella atomus]
MSWVATKDFLEIDWNIDQYRIVLEDAVGARSTISQLLQNEANKGLGYHFAIDASQEIEFAARLEKVSNTCSGANSTRLQCKEGLSLLNKRLYWHKPNMFPPNKCQQLSVVINETFLPILCINRKCPRSIVWGPKGLGGLALNTNIYSVQAQCALSYLVRTLRWNKTVAKDIIATLNAAQLASGFGQPILEVTSPKIRYLGKGWILNLRDMLDLFGIKVWTEDAWRPQRQRQYD